MADPTRRGVRPDPGPQGSETDDEIFANIRRLVQEEGRTDADPSLADERPAVDGDEDAFLLIDRIAGPAAAGDEQPLVLTQRVGGGTGSPLRPSMAPPEGALPSEPRTPPADPVGDDWRPAAAAAPTDNTVSAVAERLRRQQQARAGALTGHETVSGRSLDQLVEDMLRPMVQEWLDRHLDRIVREQTDRALRAEVDARTDGL